MTQDANALEAATRKWFGAQYDNFSGEHLRKVRNRMRGAITAYLAALRDGEATEGGDGAPQRLWISFAGLGEFQPRHIRQWQSAPFGGGIEYVRSALSATPPVAPTGTVGRNDAAEVYRQAMLEAETLLNSIPIKATTKPAIAVDPEAFKISRAADILREARHAVIFSALSAPTVEGEGL
jgi:hypothetical protein